MDDNDGWGGTFIPNQPVGNLPCLLEKITITYLGKCEDLDQTFEELNGIPREFRSPIPTKSGGESNGDIPRWVSQQIPNRPSSTNNIILFERSDRRFP